MAGQKRIKSPTKFNYPPDDFNGSNYWSSCSDIVFYENGTALACGSDWDKGYYGDVDPESPLFFFGQKIPAGD